MDEESGIASLCCHFELEAEGAHHLEYGGKFRITVERKRSIEALAAEACRTGYFSHTFGTRDDAEGMSYQDRIAIFEYRFEIIGDVLMSLQISGRILGYALEFWLVS